MWHHSCIVDFLGKMTIDNTVELWEGFLDSFVCKSLPITTVKQWLNKCTIYKVTAKIILLCYLCPSCLLRRGLVSCDSIVDRHWLPATDWHQWSAMHRTHVRYRRKFVGRFLYGVYRLGKWLWIDCNGKNGN